MKKPSGNAKVYSASFAAAMLGAAAAQASVLNDPLYIGDSGSGVVEYSTSGAATTVSTGSTQNVFAATFDSAGDAYVSNYGGNDVYELPDGGGAGTTIATVSEAFGSAFDSQGNLYVPSYANRYIVEIASSGGGNPPTAGENPATFATNVGSSSTGDLVSVAIDGSGDLFASYNNNNAAGSIIEFAATAGGVPGSVATTIATNTTDSSLKAPWQLAVDKSGNVFAVNYSTTAGAGSVLEFSPSNGTYAPSTFVSGLTFNSGHSDDGLAFDGQGDLFVLADNGTNDILQQIGDDVGGVTTAITPTTVLTTSLTTGNMINFQIISSAPEPATAGLCIVGIAGATLRRRRRTASACRV